MKEQKVERASVTRRFLDKRRNPWEYVDEALPTQTVHIFSRKKQGTMVDSSHGDVIVGSIQFSGSHYDFSPGSYSLRVTRRNASVGSIPSTNGRANWLLRHSRIGTVDSIPFYRAAARQIDVGDAMKPVYSFGPGTLWAYFNSKAGSLRVSSSLEGIF